MFILAEGKERKFKEEEEEVNHNLREEEMKAERKVEGVIEIE